MKAVCIGGGPGGLYFGICMKLRNPDHEILVLERNKADDIETIIGTMSSGREDMVLVD